MPHWRNWIAHQTSNLGVVGSNPTWGAFARAARSLTLEGGYGAMAARRIPDPKVGGSNPSSLILLVGAFLAQMVERWPFKPMVVGSIPTEGAFLLPV